MTCMYANVWSDSVLLFGTAVERFESYCEYSFTESALSRKSRSHIPSSIKNVDHRILNKTITNQIQRWWQQWRCIVSVHTVHVFLATKFFVLQKSAKYNYAQKNQLVIQPDKLEFGITSFTTLQIPSKIITSEIPCGSLLFVNFIILLITQSYNHRHFIY